MTANQRALPTLPDAMFIPDWSRPDEARVDLSTVNPGQRGFCEISIWSHQFESVDAMCDFWDFISAYEDAWPFMAMVVRRRGPAALSELLRRIGAPLPATTSG